MAEDRFARLRNASLALKFSISIGDVTINYDGVLDACSEVERLRKQCQLADSQFSQIATTVGGDARHYEGGGEQTIANFVKQEVERLRGLIVEFVAADDQLSPSKSMGSADHKRTIDRWEAAIKALKEAEVAKGET